jgi:hypothetical protein
MCQIQINSHKKYNEYLLINLFLYTIGDFNQTFHRKIIVYLWTKKI